MTSHDSGDDGDPDDAQLRSLRAVWLAMPDEDPPERGLAELMAAARVKAEVMAKPSLWQRIVTLLRRPPMLALATVVVFIGGVILIGNRSKDASEAPSSGEKQAAPQLEHAEKAEQEERAGAGSAAVLETAPEAPAEATQQALAGPPPPPPPPTEHVHRTPAHTQPTANTQATTGVKGAKTDGRAPADDKAKREETVVGGAPVRDVKNGMIEGDLDGEDRGVTRGRFDDEAPREAPQGETATAAPAKDTAAATTTDAMRPTSRASQYVAQAKSALARGDCTAAKALMKRVAAEDAGLYKKTLAADPMLDRCVRK